MGAAGRQYSSSSEGSATKKKKKKKDDRKKKKKKQSRSSSKERSKKTVKEAKKRSRSGSKKRKRSASPSPKQKRSRSGSGAKKKRKRSPSPKQKRSRSRKRRRSRSPARGSRRKSRSRRRSRERRGRTRDSRPRRRAGSPPASLLAHRHSSSYAPGRFSPPRATKIHKGEWDTTVKQEPGALWSVGDDYFPDYKPVDYNAATYQGPPGNYKLCHGCHLVAPRKLWSGRQWKQINKRGRCEACVQKELAKPRHMRPSARSAAHDTYKNDGHMLQQFVEIDDKARAAKRGIEQTTVVLTGSDIIRPTIIQKLEGFTHEDLAQILIRAGEGAQVEAENFIRKKYNTYVCKMTEDWIPAARWPHHVTGKRKKLQKQKLKDAEEKKRRRAVLPSGCPPLEAIPKDDLDKMSEQDIAIALKSRELLYKDHCLLCGVKVLAAWEQTHCTGGPHQTKFKKCPMRRVKGKDGLPPLPEGWKEFVDNGVLTYHNEDTGEQTSTRPGAAKSKKSSRSHSRSRSKSWGRRSPRKGARE